MNVPANIPERNPVRLNVASFLLLKQTGFFAEYSKPELLDGELFGVPQQADDEPEYDSSVPVKLALTDYRRLDDAGAFNDLGKTELIDGLVYAVSPQYRPHGFVKDELTYALRRALEAQASALHVATEQSVAIAPYSEPQPDIILTSEPRGTGPIPVASVALVVEISDSTLAFDLNDKARLYAGAGIPEYWVADVEVKVIHQMWGPKGDAYAERREVAFGGRIESVTVAGLVVKGT